ncbi:MAG TPA: DUF202 domain-containing protein [Pseudonocardiaceae bacterium]|nr:DUF202 domain-containing protein [Pseudonocardiaceae bacterium]
MSAPQRRRARGDGLQPERTALSWSRTSFGVLGNGALLLVRDIDHYAGALRLLPAGLAVVIAGITYLVGLQRQRVLRRLPLPAQLAPRRQIRLIGASVLVLIVVTALTLPV